MKKTFGFVVLIILVYLSWVYSWHYIDSNYTTISGRGSFGDKFGFINSLFSGLALAGIIYSIFLQQTELSLQRQELKETRAEFKNQNFQNTFFNLLRTQQKIADDILASFSYLSGFDEVSNKQITGRHFFIHSKQELLRIEEAINHKDYIEYKLWEEDDDQELAFMPQWEAESQFYNRKIAFTLYYYKIDKTAWEKAKELEGLDLSKYLFSFFFNRYQFVVGHYFRHLYHILDFLDKSKKLRLEELDATKAKLVKEINTEFEMYSNFVQAQLSSPEMFLTFYNLLSFPKFKTLIIEYNLLENLPFEDLLKEDHNCVKGINLKSKKDILE